ncbi:MAG: BamA/TamA family outer membrane protein [Chlorobi bacterium]|nr:BamA/TamA family outer membrane protein [Chlorobiota bacterium]
MKQSNLLRLIILLLAGSIWGCNSVKFVPEGEYLLQKNIVKHDAKDVTNEELKSYIRPKENKTIFGFWRFHLGMYNLAGRDSSKGFNKWLWRIGEAPVIYDEYQVEKSREQLRLFLENKGYFDAKVTDTVIVNEKKRKVKVVYDIKAGRRSYVHQVGYKIFDDTIKKLVFADTINSLLRGKKPFDVDIFDKERDRVTRMLKTNGYYNFSKNYIYFLADSSENAYLIRDTMVIAGVYKQLPDGRDTVVNHVKYKIDDVYFFVDFNPQEALIDESDYMSEFDTLYYKGYYFLFKKKMKFKPDVLINSTYIIPGQLYDITKVSKTQTLITELKLFRYINIKFSEVEGKTDENGRKYLKCYIQLTPSKPQSYALEVEGTNSSGNLGAATNVKYQHKNLLRGAEIFNVRFRLAYQNQSARGDKNNFNILETGFDAGLTFPKFLVPFRVESFRRRFHPRSSINMGLNYQRRPDYTRTIATSKLSYDWRSSEGVSHIFSILDFNLVWVPFISGDFWDYIKDTFMRYSYEDHLILNSNYTFIYNGQVLGRKNNFWYFRGYAESSGNLLDGMVKLFTKEPSNEGYYKVMGIRYAQYVKADVDLRYHHQLNLNNSFAYRFFLGVGYPYGNLHVLPFEKMYFAGGANSIRAWPVRGLGPGEYKEDQLEYYNQTADIKLELNAEYRYKMFWILEGALFVDAGNIWSIRPESSPEGGLFRFHKFYKQMAVGLGTGLRFDFSYFVFRFDVGVKAVDPSMPYGNRWVLGTTPLTWNDFGFNFAIGYPF